MPLLKIKHPAFSTDRKKITTVLFSVFLITLVLFLARASFVSAANAGLSLSPSSGSFTVGNTFSVKVIVNSGGGVGINSAGATLNFSPNYLTVRGLSTVSSIFGLWPEEPSFSNSQGKISFAGGDPSAYTGSFGNIFNITFRAEKAGNTKVTFSNAQVLAADGHGTDVLTSLGEGNYTLTGKTTPPGEQEEEEEIPSGRLPSRPQVSSPSHPEEDQWYSNNNPEFSWDLPADVTGVSLLIHKHPLANPDYYSEGLLESTKYEESVEDGQWYFHVKFKNYYGWGYPAHRQVLIDTHPPQPFEVTIQRTDPTDPQPNLVFEATDELSGIDHYEIKIGEDEWIAVKPEEMEGNQYQTPVQSPGEREVVVKALDKAGNEVSSSVTLVVEPLKAPSITEIPKEVEKGEVLIVKGVSFYPQARVEVFIQKGEEIVKGETITNQEGGWTYFHKGELEEGEYEIWAKVIDQRGAQSLPSAKVSLRVISPSLFQAYCWLIALILLLLVLILIIIIFYQKQKCSEKIKKIRKESQEVKETSTKVFHALRKEVEEQIKLLNKKSTLSEAEEKVRDKLKEALDISEEFLSKEIQDIEEELKEREKKK